MKPNPTSKPALVAVSALLVLAALPVSAEGEAPTACLNRNLTEFKDQVTISAIIDPDAALPVLPGGQPQACSGPSGPTVPDRNPCGLETSLTLETLPQDHTTATLDTICTKIREGDFWDLVEELLGTVPGIGLPEDFLDRFLPPLPTDTVSDCILDGADVCSGGLNGQQTVQCSLLGYVCALAGAHAEREGVMGPDIYNHFTSGGGMSPGGVTDGYAIYRTALGNGQCDFAAGGGCGETFSKVGYSCIKMWAVATATSGLFNSGEAAAVDNNCAD